jgi:hypothetical protein
VDPLYVDLTAKKWRAGGLFLKVISWPLRELQHSLGTPSIHLYRRVTKTRELQLSTAPERHVGDSPVGRNIMGIAPPSQPGGSTRK